MGFLPSTVPQHFPRSEIYNKALDLRYFQFNLFGFPMGKGHSRCFVFANKKTKVVAFVCLQLT